MLHLPAYLWHWPLTLTFDFEFSRSNCISGMGGPIVLEQKGQESIGYLWHWPLTLTFDSEFSRSNCISGMGGLIVLEQKGQESIGCPDVKHNHYVTLRQRILLGTGWLKMSVFPSTHLVIIIIKVSVISHCSWLSNEKMVHAVCYAMHLSIKWYGSYVKYIWTLAKNKWIHSL